MEQFKKITLEDKDTLAKYLSMKKHLACDYSVGNLVLWSSVYNTHFAISEGMLFIKFYKDGKTNFAYPMGNGDLKKAFEWLFAYCNEQNISFRMNIVEPNMFEEIEKIYPGKFAIRYLRNNADYIYKIEDLLNLSGRKYHAKKNHINKFLKTNSDWAYEKITEANKEECIEMVKKWCVENGCCGDKSKADEVCVLIKGLRHMEELNMLGGALRAAGKIVALTIGEKASEDTFIIHFEKAFSYVGGAYPMINQQFIKHELTNYTFVNREEDMGLEGLRKAKESYYPVFMAEKGLLIRK